MEMMCISMMIYDENAVNMHMYIYIYKKYHSYKNRYK